MPFVVAPSKNKILQAAWAGHIAVQRAEGKKKPVPAEVHKPPRKTASKVTEVHKPAEKAHKHVATYYGHHSPKALELAGRELVAAHPFSSHPKEECVEHEGYRRLVAARPCENCGRQKRSQAAHVPPDGKGMKRDDRLTFALCCDGPRFKGCHPKFDQYELMPHDKAVAQGLKWARKTRREIAAAGKWPKNLPAWPGDKKAAK